MGEFLISNPIGEWRAGRLQEEEWLEFFEKMQLQADLLHLPGAQSSRSSLPITYFRGITLCVCSSRLSTFFIHFRGFATTNTEAKLTFQKKTDFPA